jgi:hypothetical protein
MSEDLPGVAVSCAEINSGCEILWDDITRCDIAPLSSELTNKLASHASTTAGDDSDKPAVSIFKTLSHGAPFVCCALQHIDSTAWG